MRDEPRSLAFVPLADALRRMGQRAEAMAALRQGMKHHPDHAPAQVVMARLHLEAGARPLAVAMLEEIVQSDPENVAAGAMLAGLLVDDGRLRDARLILERLRLAAGQDPVIQALLVRANPTARALHGTPGDPFDTARWADVLAARGDFPRATRAWQRIYTANPRDPRPRSRLVELSRAVDGLGEGASEPRPPSRRKRLPGTADVVRALWETADGPCPESGGPLGEWLRSFWSPAETTGSSG